jgi:hypothetical protein
MPRPLRNLLVVLGAIVVATGITLLPWWILFRLDGPDSNFWGMTAILWAPLALLVGLVLGGVFAVFAWARKPRGD